MGEKKKILNLFFKREKKSNKRGKKFWPAHLIMATLAESSRRYLRLYKHALESIFSHLNLSELARISATCRDWSAAVNSMRIRRPAVFQSMCTSRLARHVSGIHIFAASVYLSGLLASLCDFIKQSKSMNEVVLGYNSIGDAGAVALADAIAQSNSLTTVNLSDNWIGNRGASAIAEAIKQSKSLTTVGLGFNEIGAIGASAIAEAIKQSQSLTTVDLRGNAIGAEGADAIAGAIKQSKSLTTGTITSDQPVYPPSQRPSSKTN